METKIMFALLILVWAGLAVFTGRLLYYMSADYMSTEKIHTNRQEPFDIAETKTVEPPHQDESIYCDVCGRNLTHDGESVIGFRYQMLDRRTQPNGSLHPEYARIKDVFGKDEFNICFVDWLKALGIKPIKEGE